MYVVATGHGLKAWEIKEMTEDLLGGKSLAI